MDSHPGEALPAIEAKLRAELDMAVMAEHGWRDAYNELKDRLAQLERERDDAVGSMMDLYVDDAA